MAAKLLVLFLLSGMPWGAGVVYRYALIWVLISRSKYLDIKERGKFLIVQIFTLWKKGVCRSVLNLKGKVIMRFVLNIEYSILLSTSNINYLMFILTRIWDNTGNRIRDFDAILGRLAMLFQSWLLWNYEWIPIQLLELGNLTMLYGGVSNLCQCQQLWPKVTLGNLTILYGGVSNLCQCQQLWSKVTKNGCFGLFSFCSAKTPPKGLVLLQQTMHEWITLA